MEKHHTPVVEMKHLLAALDNSIILLKLEGYYRRECGMEREDAAQHALEALNGLRWWSEKCRKRDKES